MDWKLNDIVDNGLCANCGTCAIICPNNIIEFEDKGNNEKTPKLKEECLRKGHGACYDICPRVSTGGYQISIRENFNENYYYGKGNVEGQDGGIVTTFLKYLIENNKIDGAVLVDDQLWKPTSVVIQNSEDIEKCAKSKYTISTLEGLRKAGELGIEKVAVVGLPCQINALRKLQYFPFLAKYDGEPGKNGKYAKLPKIEYLIGLFCTKKFSYSNLKEVLENNNINIANVVKFDIKKGNLIILLNDNTEKQISLKEFKACEGCKVCNDFIGKFADLSVGSVGSPEGYTTVITLTEKGEEIKNCVDLKTDVDLDKVNKLKNTKINNFKKEINKRIEENKKVSYYWISDFGGVGKRGDGNHFIRIRGKPSGFYKLDDVNYITNLTEQYGGILKLTNRGAFEIHNIKPIDVDEIVNKLKEKDLVTGSEGPLVRATLACPGEVNCSSGLINTVDLCKYIEDNFKETPTNYKFKIAISGCPNKCVRPQITDIGIVGIKKPVVVEDKCNGCGRCFDVCKIGAIDIRGETSYTNKNICNSCGKCIKACPNEGREVKEDGYLLYIGGKSGREIVEGISIDNINNKEQLIKIIDCVIKTYNKYAIKPQRERLSATMERIGKGKFLDEVMENAK